MKVIYIPLLLLGSVWCNNEVFEDPRELEKAINEIPGLENFSQSNLTALEDALKLKCEKNGGKDAFNNLLAAKVQLIECVRSNLNFTQIQEEIEVAREKRNMDDVFAKHCRKAPIVQKCFKDVMEAIKPCVEKEEKSTLKLFSNITDSLGNFVCYKDGDRISMFVAEGGFECLQLKQEEMEVCTNKTLSHILPKNLSLTNLPLFVLNSEGCDDYVSLQDCIVEVLQTCHEKTPGNIIEALFKYLRKITPCKNHPVATSLRENHYHRFGRSPASPQPGLGAVDTAVDQVIAKYHPHCLKNGGPKAAEELEQALGQMKQCFNSSQTNLKQKLKETGELSVPYLCKDFRSEIRACLDNLTGKMKTCSSHEETYVSKLALDIYDSVSGFYCKDDGRALKKFIAGDDVCLNKVHNSTVYCLNKTKHIKVYGNEDVVTKNELCGDLRTLKSCFMDVATQQCPSSSNPNELVIGLSDAVYAPCSGYKVFITNALLLLLVICVKFF